MQVKYGKIVVSMLLALCVAGCGNEKVTDKQMTIPMVNGMETIQQNGTYTGEINKDGKPEGKGVFKSNNTKGTKWTYEGTFKNGTFEGKGSLTFENGYKREGEYHNGAENGQIKETDNGKLLYEGEFKNAKKNGKGKVYDSKTGKLVYEGELVNDLVHGQGAYYDKDGNVKYKGNFVKGFIAKGEIGLNEKTSALEWEYSVSGTKRYKTIGNKAANGIFVLVLVDAKNNSNLARAMGTNFFYLADDKGRAFDMADVNLSYSIATNSYGTDYYTKINPGLTAKGVRFFFDVPEDCKELSLRASYDMKGEACAIKIKG